MRVGGVNQDGFRALLIPAVLAPPAETRRSPAPSPSSGLQDGRQREELNRQLGNNISPGNVAKDLQVTYPATSFVLLFLLLLLLLLLRSGGPESGIGPTEGGRKEGQEFQEAQLDNLIQLTMLEIPIEILEDS